MPPCEVSLTPTTVCPFDRAWCRAFASVRGCRERRVEQLAQVGQRGEPREARVRRRRLQPLALQQLRRRGAREVAVEGGAAVDVDRAVELDQFEAQPVL